MNANPRDKYNGGIKLACDNATGQVGLSYLNGTVVVMAPFSYISDGYFGKNLQMPVREGKDVYFIPFEAVLNQQPAPLTTVCPSKLSDGSLIESTDMSILASYTSPLPAFVTGRGFGLIYTSDASFVDHFGRAPVYENVPITYELDKKHVTQTEVLFLSMQSILLSPLMADMEEWDPVELVPLSSVKAYLPSLAGPTAAATVPNATIPLGSLSYAAPKSVSKVTFTDANAVLHRTPSANHAALSAQQQLGQRAKGSHSGGDNSDSAGLTTGDSMSTGHKQHRLHTAPDTACSSPSHSDRSAASSPCSSLATSPVATMSSKRSTVAARFTSMSGLELLRARVPGPCDIWAEKDLRRSAKGVSKVEANEQQARAMAIRDFLSTGWAALEGKGFLINWGWDQRGDQLKSFLLHGKNKFSHLKDCKLIENLECFHTGESLYTHVQANPCLLEPWPKVFSRLSQQGWMRAEHQSNSTSGSQTMFYFFSGTAVYRESSAKAGRKKVVVPSSVEEARAQGIVPGQLLFTSRGAMMRYIARYPFLLQSPEEFCETLQRLNWRTDIDNNDVQRWLWEPTAEDRNGTCPWHFRSPSSGTTSSSSRASHTETWVNLAELTRRLWLVPERLFQYVTPPLPVSALRQAIHLSEEEALAADQDIFSPEVKGVARADRDKWCTAATDKLSAYLSLCNRKSQGSAEMGVQLEDSIKKLLKNLSWTEDRCAWSKEWWGNETAWVAPWTQQMVEVGNEPLLGRDYFWTMQHLAEYVSELTQPEWQAQHGFLYSPLLQCVEAFTPCPAQARAALREHANNLVLKLVRNGRGNPFEEGPLKDMLLTTGWEVFGDDAHDVVVFVPHWRTKDVNRKNYRQYQSGVDYFDTLDGVQSHLEGHGNQAVPVFVEKKMKKKAIKQQEQPVEEDEMDQEEEVAPAPYVSPSEQIVAHLDKRYARLSIEGQVVEQLEKSSHYFPHIFPLLKLLGWSTAYQKGNDQGFFVTPWGLQRTDAFKDVNVQKPTILDLTLLREGVDFFRETSDGKLQLIDYLLKRGLEERMTDFDPFLGLNIKESSAPAPRGQKTTTSTSEQSRLEGNDNQEQQVIVPKKKRAAPAPYVSPSDELVAHLDKHFTRGSLEGQVLEQLEKDTPFFPHVFAILKHMGWSTAYQKGNNQGFFVTPWGLKRERAFTDSTSKIRTIRDLTLLREGVDFFRETSDGKLQLIDYLLKRGFEERIADVGPSQGQQQIKANTARGAKDTQENAEASITNTKVKKAAAAIVAPVASDSTHSSPASSVGSVFHHLGESYDVVTPQAQALIEILEGDGSFPKVFSCLQKLGWSTSWLNFDSGFLVTPWGFARPGAFVMMKGSKPKLVDLSKLRENIDYFADTKEGRSAMFEYLVKRGFEEREEDYDPNNPPTPKAMDVDEDQQQEQAQSSPSQLSSSTSSEQSVSRTSPRRSHPVSSLSSRVAQECVGPVFTAEGVTHLGHFYDAESAQYRVVRALFANPLHWGTVYNHLAADFLWGTHYVEELKVTFIVAGWALDVPGAFFVNQKSHFQLGDYSVLEENVDYFQETVEGKERMIEYLRTHGIERPEGRATPDNKGEDNEMQVDGDDAGEVEQQEEEEEELAQSQRQETKKRKASSSPQKEHRRTVGEGHRSSRNSTTQSGGRRCFVIDPAAEVCPFFASDWATLRQQMQKGHLVLSTKTDAPLEMWLALEKINRSWRYLKLSETKALYLRTSGCNEYTLSKFTEGLDYFRSQKAFWKFIQQQYALHLDSHSLITQEEKAGTSSRRPRAGSSSASGSESSTKQASRASSVATAPAASTVAPKTAVDSADFALKRFDSLTIRKRSPAKACYRAADPSSNLDRLVAGVSSPAGSGADGDVDAESSDEESYFQRRNLAASTFGDKASPGMVKASYDEDMQEVFCDILQSSPEEQHQQRLLPTRASTATTQPDAMDVGDFEDDTDYIPLTQHLGGGEGEPSIVDMLSAAQPPFQRILQKLGWSYAYIGSNRLPNGEPSGGLSHVYIRPGRDLQSPGMIKGEDYFLTEESLIDYLRVQFGLQNMPEYVSNTKKPRATRSGRIIDGSDGGTSASAAPATSSTVPRSAHSSPVVTSSKTALPVLLSKPTTLGGAGNDAKVSIGGEKRTRAASSLTAEPLDNSKRLRRSGSTSSNSSEGSNSKDTIVLAAPAPAPVPTPQLVGYDAVAKALSAASKQSSYRMGPKESTASYSEPLGRQFEHSQLLSIVAGSLIHGRGAAAYVCGSPGMGKTHTLVTVLNYVEQDRRDVLLKRGEDADTLGYKVLWLSGAGLKSKHDVFAPIAEQLGLKPTAYSSLNKGNSKSNRSEAEQMVIERFSSPGEPIDLNVLSHTKLLDTNSASSSESAPAQPASPAPRGRKERKNSGSPDSAQKGRPRSKQVPMTVLVIDEMDMANRDAVAQLCLLATCSPASLVIIGLGNQVNHTMNLIHISSSKQVDQVQQIVLEPYNEGKLAAILTSLTGGLFQERAINFLASKVFKNDKGDVRKMLGYAWSSLTAARSKLSSSEDLNGPIVTIKHITEAYGSQKDPKLDLLKNFNGLTLRLLVVLLRMESEASHSSLSQFNILRAFSDYLERKQIPTEAPCIVLDRLNTLLMYSFLRVARQDKRDSNRTMYSLDVTVDVMLQMEFSAEHGNLREELMQIKNNQRRREAEDSLALL